MRAADVMTTDVVAVGPDARVVEVAETLLASRISAVPIIGEGGELVGIVSEGDLMRRSETGTERRRAWWLEALVGRTTLANDYVQANAQKVADIMTRNVVTATPDTPLGEIAALLERHHIKRVPIVRGGKILGIVSRANLIQALASIRKKISIATAPEDSAIRGVCCGMPRLCCARGARHGNRYPTSRKPRCGKRWSGLILCGTSYFPPSRPASSSFSSSALKSTPMVSISGFASRVLRISPATLARGRSDRRGRHD